MSIAKKIKTKLQIEWKFLTQQKWGVVQSSDVYDIPKFQLKKYLPTDAVIIDCGAHVGADSIELSRIFAKGQVHSFEPVSELYNKLVHNVRRRKNIKTYKLALGSTNEFTQMHVSSGASDASSSLLPPKEHLNQHTQVFFQDTIDVEVKKLDTWASEHDIDHVDFMWLDMQGFELPMLKESSLILPTVKAIFTEVSLNESYEGVTMYPEYKEWLEKQGFSLEFEFIPKTSDMGNALFVRKH
jgi:FkbM family methyltransferase